MSRPRYSGEPTLGRVMRRPQWILALLLALAVAAAFAWLAQWQMDSAIRLDKNEIDSETVVPLETFAETNTPVTDASGGLMGSVHGRIDPGHGLIVEKRVNQGVTGYWVIGRAVLDSGDNLVMALGWAETFEEAERAREAIDRDERLTRAQTIIGRYMPSEGPVIPKPSEPLPETVLPSLATGQVINLWPELDGGVYAGYLVADEAPAGLEKIDSVPPLPQETINWLNLFYAAEWVVFAGFAVFFWYRLARDAWEKEHELKLLEADEAASEPAEAARSTQ